MHFPTFFIPFQSLFFPNMIFVHIFGQTEKYTPLLNNGDYNSINRCCFKSNDFKALEKSEDVLIYQLLSRDNDTQNWLS